ncbi:iron-siderophore ABC transporter substrate-binding protein [Schumannella sp. 10F1B-5-1]|uniref:ABC transporter substrate-binding protein n=1 Tax=Schumannella sp. 10F1B-5-1 TaxID=2590780 RepID=UPI0011302BF7|nr:iron-siderophore ABC transporter substrate-binding protein [Schumannella sp. 10F1B-5-1]TPW78454.1 iron-siderophore ABC transporter substrate-binding protein [Schumannella sp. 10F1B-5-1]
MPRFRRLLPAIGAAAAVAVALAGCGTTESTGSASGSGSLTVTDSRGEKVKLDGPATRVIGTEWNVVEMMVSLGVQPVGVADIDGYDTWVKSAELTGDPTDIGTRGEPSMDSIAAADPDVVIATDDLSASAIKQIEKLVPVVVVKSADASSPETQIRNMKDAVNLIAETTGTEDAATTLLSAFDDKVAEGKAAVEAAGLAGTPLAFADGWTTDGQTSVRPFLGGSLLGSLNEAVGFTTPWTVEGDEAYGLGSTDVEGLTSLPADTKFVYITGEGQDAFGADLKGNAVWESLGFVQAGEVHRLADGIWMFGGPASAEAYIDALVKAVGA